MKKSGQNSSEAAEAFYKATLDLSNAQYKKLDSTDSEAVENAAQEQLNALASPATAEQCNLVGAPTVKTQGGLSTQLHDTSKNPNLINASAHAERLRLAKNARSLDLVADLTETVQPQNSVEWILCHQLAALHNGSMRLMEKSLNWLDDADPGYSQSNAVAAMEAVRLANASARMMKTFQEGVAALSKMRGGGSQQVTVVHQHVQVAGGNVAVAGNVTPGDHKQS